MFSYLLFVLSPQVHLVVPGDRISLLYTYLCTTDYEKNKSMKKKKKKSVSVNSPPPSPRYYWILKLLSPPII